MSRFIRDREWLKSDNLNKDEWKEFKELVEKMDSAHRSFFLWSGKQNSLNSDFMRLLGLAGLRRLEIRLIR